MWLEAGSGDALRGEAGARLGTRAADPQRCLVACMLFAVVVAVRRRGAGERVERLAAWRELYLQQQKRVIEP